MQLILDTENVIIQNRQFTNSDISELVIISQNVYIGYNAFADSQYLTTITFEPKTQTQTVFIDKHAFRCCTVLQTLNIPAQTTVVIDSAAFTDCIALKTIIANGILELKGEEIFANCTKLSSVSLTACKCIPIRTFSRCSKLATFKLPIDLEEIGQYAFQKCQTLNFSQQSFPTSLRKIGDSAFKRCFGITYIDLSQTQLTEIEHLVFDDCCSLSVIILPKCCTKIERHAFKNCCYLNVDGISTED